MSLKISRFLFVILYIYYYKYQTPHASIVAASSFCVCYSLSIEAILEMKKNDPKVAMMLEKALSRAIYDQEEEIGRYFMRLDRKQFLNGIKEKAKLLKRIQVNEAIR